ncbi:hypothetical protein LR066_00225, partial [candidate division WOR-3 bacterium]|nr:hypothetical protein [candidate division WOR-3 bacterium]
KIEFFSVKFSVILWLYALCGLKKKYPGVIPGKIYPGPPPSRVPRKLYLAGNPSITVAGL